MSSFGMWCKITAILTFTCLIYECIGLSTFGVSNTKPPAPATPRPPPARPCSRQADCAGISSSSCVRTHYDSVTRCLCGDNSPPLNGQCEAQSKLLYHVCANSDECNDGLVCGAPNITGNAQPHLRVLTPQDKICLCDTESGYREREYTCSDAEILKTSIFAIIFVTSLRKIVFY
ncbi:PREDICTED: uncharacterized protein LOC106125996 isoform X3 [Papilio xuthus]|uniref:Uncharacterized protein LOC106125996 isoform X3 n=1 Tax=Papilio xuthus TaxID=66420 RepID=A0AAJ6ZTC6_PAPXU|nr:PREDICTED: uncharacterized protein LOC106125996 isoform X3 [Papilio xuthus]XP_013178868.1 PREDICTED: uncharacterized protein LOC106125996 isoform X3 [Papilio xuthus]